MIVRNEASRIGQALASVRALADEIVVVDTGSSDQSVEIARSFGAQIFSFPWQDNFAAARNFSLSHCYADWILILDADEQIAAADHAALRDLISSSSALDCFRLYQRHYTEDHRAAGYQPNAGEYPDYERYSPGHFRTGCVRLFPNGQGIQFEGRVHELVEPCIEHRGAFRVIECKIPIHHFGHLDKERRRERHVQYLELGKQKVLDQTSDWKAQYELGIEFLSGGDLNQSAALLTSALSHNPEFIPAWVNIGYVMNELGRTEHAIAALSHAIKRDPSLPEAWNNLGLVHLRRADLSQAEDSFRRCLELSPNFVVALTNLARCVSLQGKNGAAAELYQAALKIMPDCFDAQVDLAALWMQNGDFETARSLVTSALRGDPKLPKARFVAFDLARREGQRQQARDHLKQYLVLINDKNIGVGLDSAFVSALHGQLAQLEAEIKNA